MIQITDKSSRQVLRSIRSAGELEKPFWETCITVETLLDLNRPHQALDLMESMEVPPISKGFMQIVSLRHRIAHALIRDKCGVEAYEKLLQAQANSPGPLQEYGYHLLLLGRPKDARDKFRDSIRAC